MNQKIEYLKFAWIIFHALLMFGLITAAFYLMKLGEYAQANTALLIYLTTRHLNDISINITRTRTYKINENL